MDLSYPEPTGQRWEENYASLGRAVSDEDVCSSAHPLAMDLSHPEPTGQRWEENYASLGRAVSDEHASSSAHPSAMAMNHWAVHRRREEIPYGSSRGRPISDDCINSIGPLVCDGLDSLVNCGPRRQR